jgi:hypothetical protein
LSHLSILPTVIRDLDLLAASLVDLGCDPIRAGVLEGFAGERTPVDLKVRFAGEQWIGWTRQADGSLALLGDLQRLSRSRPLQTFLGRLTRGYAARLALQDAALELPMATIELVS